MPTRLRTFDPSEWPHELSTALGAWQRARMAWVDEHPGAVDVVEALREFRAARQWVAAQQRAERGA